SDIVVEHTQAKSRDGTLVPMTILSPKAAKRDGKTPTMLYGYGSYGIPIMPNFQTVRRGWFDEGAIMAYAHVRGGGELGRAWQDGGSKGNKERSFEDFIACAETLVANHVTDSEHLSAYGGSAGGILVNSVVVRRPDLFRAAFVEVGDANMLRVEQYPDGPQSAEEFGSVKTLEGFRGLLAMDAYHHVVPHTRYPAMMYSTGVNDPRVPSWSPAKMAARVQAATGSGRPVLMRVDFDAGHGVSSTRSQITELRADFYSFLLWQLGHPAFSAEPESTSGP
ncbi:MAG TPA: prolyl oligopeptidase family serine peptidase, partial [Polyangiaceae bacterium]|nr:prolyl oligopeptidase family serine peptidase [Polyangiaceae bacterium]